MTDTKEADLKRRIDLRRAVTDRPPYGRQPVKLLCPFHDDKAESGAVYPDGYYCHACGANLSPAAFLMHRNGYDTWAEAYAEAERLAALGRASEPAPSKPDTEMLAAMVARWSENPALGYWHERGFSTNTVVSARLGHTGRAHIVPLYDWDGKLFSVKYRRDDRHDPDGPKYWTRPGYGKTAVYYPPLRDWQHHTGPVVVAEGELDALLLAQHGVPAVSATTGVGSVPGLVVPLLTRHGGLVLCLDQDEPGRKGAKACLEAAAEWPGRVEPTYWYAENCGKDVGDAFRDRHAWDGLLHLLRNAYRTVQRAAAEGVGRERA